MTTLDVMLKWYASDTENTVIRCDECGCELQSADGRPRKMVCEKCQRQRKLDAAYRNNRLNGRVKFDFRDDPATALVFAVIMQAIHDKTWQWKAPLMDPEPLNLRDCDPAEFLQDGADVWLASLGIGIRPSMRKALMEVEL